VKCVSGRKADSETFLAETFLRGLLPYRKGFQGGLKTLAVRRRICRTG
jgi:hypothetical protein